MRAPEVFVGVRRGVIVDRKILLRRRRRLLFLLWQLFVWVSPSSSFCWRPYQQSYVVEVIHAEKYSDVRETEF